MKGQDSRVQFCLIALVIILSPVLAEKNDTTFLTAEKDLYNKLMTGYIKELRPVENANQSVQVQLGYNMVHIEDLDQTTHILTTHGWLRMMWQDIELQWDPKDHDWISTMNLPYKKIWTPDILPYNSAQPKIELSFDPLAVVASNGMVTFIPQVKLATQCAMNLQHFPFDTQTCEIKLGSWTFSSDKINLKLFPGRHDLEYTTPHREWIAEEYTVKRNDVRYPCCEEIYQDITYKLTLKRQPKFYIHLFLAPSLVLTLLVPTIFLLPADTSDKMNFGSTLLLGNVLMILILIEFLPGAHFTVPLIGHDFLFGLAYTATALVMAAVVKVVWNQSTQRRSMPSFVRTIVLGVFGRLCCVKRDVYMPLDEMEPISMRQLTDMNSGDRETFQTANDDKMRIVKSYARITAVSEWRQLAVIMDRLLFVVYLVISLISAIVMGQG